MSLQSEARDHFYHEGLIDNEAFGEKPTCDWCFQSKAMIIQNDSRQTISYSFNGRDVDGTIKPSDKWVALDKKTEGKIWLKTSKAVPAKSAVRLTVWRGEV